MLQMHIRPLAYFLVLLLGLGALTGCDDRPPLQPGQCEIETLGRLRLDQMDNVPVVEAKIDDRPVLFLVDTGAFNSVIFSKNATKSSLIYTGAIAHTLGAHGHEEQPVVQINKLDLGSAHSNDHLFILTSTIAAKSKAGRPPIIGLLGAEFLLASDLVIDMPHHAMYLLNMHRCPFITPFWRGAVHTIPIEHDHVDNKIRLTFTVNDSKPIPAVFDTGASGIVIPYPLAHSKIGITRQDLKNDQSTTDIEAIGEDKVTSYRHTFDHLDLGDFRINNARVTIDDADYLDDALFGAHFLQHARIWLTTKNVMYVQYLSEMQDAPSIPIEK